MSQEMLSVHVIYLDYEQAVPSSRFSQINGRNKKSSASWRDSFTAELARTTIGRIIPTSYDIPMVKAEHNRRDQTIHFPYGCPK